MGKKTRTRATSKRSKKVQSHGDREKTGKLRGPDGASHRLERDGERTVTGRGREERREGRKEGRRQPCRACVRAAGSSRVT